MIEYPIRLRVGCFHFESFSKTFHFLLTSGEIGSTIDIDEQMFGVQKRRERHGVAAQSTA